MYYLLISIVIGLFIGMLFLNLYFRAKVFKVYGVLVRNHVEFGAAHIFNRKKLEAEIGLRAEYVGLQYNVNPNHNTYKSDGYNYAQPFPTLRFAYKFNDNNKLSAFYNRRVDRPNEVDIRIFPKYDDAEIIKVGNPGLKPQFTNSFELNYTRKTKIGSISTVVFYRIINQEITRFVQIDPANNSRNIMSYANFKDNDSYGAEISGNLDFG